MNFDKIVVPTFEEFLQKFTKFSSVTNKTILVVDWLNKLPETDYRSNNVEYLQAIYDFLWLDHIHVLKEWFFEHAEFKEDTVLRFKSYNNIVQNKEINGRYYNHAGRVVRNLFYKNIYLETKKSNTDTNSVLDFFIEFYLNNRTERHLLIPSMIETIKNKDTHGLFIVLLGTHCKASIFNPYTYSYILNTIIKGDKLLCPVMSWCSPVVALHNSSYSELVGIDVIPKVCSKATELHDYYNSQKNIFEDEKLAKIYCCPSEKIDIQHNFIYQYENYFDTVFFSPPYYDVEQYEGGEQSWESFKTYEEWLEGYWRPTVELCYATLKNNGVFSFVIIPEYKPLGKDKVTISHDMLKIAREYFVLEDHYNLNWGGFSAIKEQDHKKITNIVEDFWILRKK